MQERYISEQSEYEVIRLLGKGATGEVYLVQNPDSSAYFAMKVCEDAALLRQESELLKRVGQIVRQTTEPLKETVENTIFPQWVDYFEADRGYLVMEYIPGITLQQYLEKFGKMSRKLAGEIIGTILDALEDLHSRTPQIIYRDLKAENIMISSEGQIRMIDLGGAAAAKYRVGTYGYGAPEQFWEGAKTGPECDLYAVGKLLAFMLTGKDPCQPPYDILRFCENDKKITSRMLQVLQRSMAVESLGRYGSAKEFKREWITAVKQSEYKKRTIFVKKQEIIYEKCIWKSEYKRAIDQ